jgi:hypothetical protein
MMGFFGFYDGRERLARFIEMLSAHLKLGEGVAFTFWPTRGAVAFFDTASGMTTGTVPIADLQGLMDGSEPRSREMMGHREMLARARLLLEPVASLEPVMVMRQAQVGG